MACGVCGVGGSEGRAPRPKIRWMQAGMGVLGGTIARSIASRHVGIVLRVNAGCRRAANRVRVGVALAVSSW
jgi:hypothetical protein